MDKVVRVDVDTQFGFADPAGGLYVKGGEVAAQKAAFLNAEAIRHGMGLIGSVDTHEAHSPEFTQNGGIWPVHCVKGTRDWLKIPNTLPEKFVILADADSTGKRYTAAIGKQGVAVYFEKDQYSLFDNHHAADIVSHYNGLGYAFEVYGIATDYCVSAAALGIKERHPNAKVTVLLDACAAVSPATEAEALAKMEAAGIILDRRPL